MVSPMDDAAVPRPAGGAPAEAAAVVAFWQDLGLPGLVDIHTHFMPPNVLAKVWAYFDGGRAGVDRAWPIAYRLPEDLGAALLRAVCHDNAVRLLGL